MRLGIIGSGAIGSTVGKLWIQAGHEVMFSSRHPEKLAGLTEEADPAASTGTPEDATAFGETVLLAVNWWTVDEALDAAGDALAGKAVLDATNPYVWRAGGGLERTIPEGESGVETLSRKVPAALWVKALGHLPAGVLAAQAHRSLEQAAGLYCGDDQGALEIAQRLISDAGYEPILIGPLSVAGSMELGGSLNGKVLSAEEARQLTEEGF